jgi:hypothetical protein
VKTQEDTGLQTDSSDEDGMIKNDIEKDEAKNEKRENLKKKSKPLIAALVKQVQVVKQMKNQIANKRSKGKIVAKI